MICQFCKKREATIHFTNMVGSKVEKIHICPHCAEEKGFDYLKKSNFAMGDLLAGLLNSEVKTEKAEKKKDGCPNCGRSYSAFKKVGKLGCSQCYDFFHQQLMPLLRSVHGNTRYLGKVPKRFGAQVNLRRRVVKLQEELNRAVEQEEFERAAELRDRIKSLKESVNTERE